MSDFENNQSTTNVEQAVQMSEVQTLTSIFFEPGRTFQSFLTKPRFIFASLIIIVLSITFQQLFMQRMGSERLKRYVAEQVEKNPQVQSMDADAKNKIVDQQVTISNYAQFAVPVIILIVFAIIGLLYWLGSSAMGGTGSFLKGLAVCVYSSLPPTVIGTFANILILYLKSPDEIDFGMSQRGLVNANASFLIDGKAMPVLATLLSTIDIFQIWGWVLAAIGLKIVSKISIASAWTVVLILALIGISFRVLGAYFSGNPS